MKVLLKTTMAGPAGIFKAGTVVELPEATTKSLLAGGYAVAVDAAGTPSPEPVKTAEPEAKKGKKPAKDE